MTRRNGNHKASYPGRPRRCDAIPGSKACKKCQSKGNMLCKHCRSLEARASA